MRYIVTIDFYITADSDNNALLAAEETAKDMRYNYDNQAKVLSVVEQNFGTMTHKDVLTYEQITNKLLTAIKDKKTTRNKICHLCSITLPTIHKRFAIHNWKDVEIQALKAAHLI